MTVKELIEKLKQYDGEREVYMRFALDEEDEIGYIFKTVGSYEFLDGDLFIVAEDTATNEDYAAVGQLDLKGLYKKSKRRTFGRRIGMSKEELIIEHNEMVTKLLKEVQYLYNHRHYSNDIVIEKFCNLEKLLKTLEDMLEVKETPEERRLKERVDKAGERLEKLTDGLIELDFPKTKEYLLKMEKYFNKCGDIAEETLNNIKKMMRKDEDLDYDEGLDYIDFVGDTTKNDR